MVDFRLEPDIIIDNATMKLILSLYNLSTVCGLMKRMAPGSDGLGVGRVA